MVLLPLAWLGWQIIGNTMVDSQSRSDPETALLWRPNASVALSALAEDQLVAAETAGDLEAIVGLLRRALQSGPLEPRAVRLLALVADLRGEKDRAESLMSLAAERSQRDVVAQVWLFQERTNAGDYAGALIHADAILRSRPDLGALLLPTLSEFAANPEALAGLVDALGSNPPWRPWFLRELPRQGGASSVTYAVLSDLRDSANPPADSELRSHLNQLIENGQFEMAFLAWMQFLPGDRSESIRYVHNGDFEFPVTGLPFDWIISDVRGAITEIVDSEMEDLGRAVRIVFANTRVRYRHLAKMLILPPGSYRLSGLVMAENLTNERGMVWRVSCAEGDKQVVGESDPVANTVSWGEFNVGFEVPPFDCRAQWLRLELAARIALEEQVGGTIWYDNLVVERARSGDVSDVKSDEAR